MVLISLYKCTSKCNNIFLFFFFLVLEYHIKAQFHFHLKKLIIGIHEMDEDLFNCLLSYGNLRILKTFV